MSTLEFNADPPEPFWFKALRRLGPALDTVKATPLCSEIQRIEVEIRDELYTAIERSDWSTAHDLTGQLVELSRFKELVCRR